MSATELAMLMGGSRPTKQSKHAMMVAKANNQVRGNNGRFGGPKEMSIGPEVPEGPSPRLKRPPREVTFELVHAPPHLVVEFKQARKRYQEAIFTWWHRSGKRFRGQLPTDEEFEAAQSDPDIIAAGKELDAVDRQLSELGNVVRTTTVKNDRDYPRTLRVEEMQMDRQHYQSLRESQTPAEGAEEDAADESNAALPSKKQKMDDGSAKATKTGGSVAPSAASSRQSVTRSSEQRSMGSPAPSASSSTKEAAGTRRARRANRDSTSTSTEQKK